MLKSELSNSNSIAERMEKEYKKILSTSNSSISQNAYSKSQKTQPEKKYGSILNSTSVSQRNHELEQSNLLMSRKFSCTQDGRLSNTLINYGDSNAMNSIMLSSEKDPQQIYTDRDFSKVNFSPINPKSKSRNHHIKESQSAATLSIHQLQKARIPSQKDY